MPTYEGMDVSMFVQVAAAVVLANAACFACFMAAMTMSKLQKQGVKDDAFPWWVYPCFFVAPALVFGGALLLP